jgi:protein-tyrosine phosphatase
MVRLVAALHPVNEILPGLYLGGEKAAKIIRPYLHVACAAECPPDQRLASCNVFVPLHDNQHVEWVNDPRWCRRVLKASKYVADDVVKGRRVLVTCHMGLNRSGLVCGLALCRLGYTPKEAIDLMRRLRNEEVLCNPKFVKAVKRLGAQFGG